MRLLETVRQVVWIEVVFLLVGLVDGAFASLAHGG